MKWGVRGQLSRIDTTLIYLINKSHAYLMQDICLSKMINFLHMKDKAEAWHKVKRKRRENRKPPNFQNPPQTKETKR